MEVATHPFVAPRGAWRRRRRRRAHAVIPVAGGVVAGHLALEVEQHIGRAPGCARPRRRRGGRRRRQYVAQTVLVIVVPAGVIVARDVAHGVFEHLERASGCALSYHSRRQRLRHRARRSRRRRRGPHRGHAVDVVRHRVVGVVVARVLTVPVAGERAAGAVVAGAKVAHDQARALACHQTGRPRAHDERQALVNDELSWREWARRALSRGWGGRRTADDDGGRGALEGRDGLDAAAHARQLAELARVRREDLDGRQEVQHRTRGYALTPARHSARLGGRHRPAYK